MVGTGGQLGAGHEVVDGRCGSQGQDEGARCGAVAPHLHRVGDAGRHGNGQAAGHGARWEPATATVTRSRR